MDSIKNGNGVKNLNIISLICVLALYIALGIFGYAVGLHWILFSGSIVFSLFNGFFYFIPEQSRVSVVKNRVFAVYFGGVVILFFAAFDALHLIFYGISWLTSGLSIALAWVLNIAFITAAVF